MRLTGCNAFYQGWLHGLLLGYSVQSMPRYKTDEAFRAGADTAIESGPTRGLEALDGEIAGGHVLVEL